MVASNRVGLEEKMATPQRLWGRASPTLRVDCRFLFIPGCVQPEKQGNVNSEQQSRKQWQVTLVPGIFLCTGMLRLVKAALLSHWGCSELQVCEPGATAHFFSGSLHLGLSETECGMVFCPEDMVPWETKCGTKDGDSPFTEAVRRQSERRNKSSVWALNVMPVGDF